MTTSDPAIHQDRERRFLTHFETLLMDDQLAVSTRRGRRPIVTMLRSVVALDRGVELKRLMSEMGRPDRQLESQMPLDRSIEVGLFRPRWWIWKEPLGRLRAMVVAPWAALIAGQSPAPMSALDLGRALAQVAPPVHQVPTTLVLMSTSGFTEEARKLAEVKDGRSVILVEPVEGGDATGWRISAPAEESDFAARLDPESTADKRQRIAAAIAGRRVELLSGSVSAEQIAADVHLSQKLVEQGLKSYAAENAGYAARRLDGKWLLFREGDAMSSPAISAGASMPFIERVKALFSRKGEVEKKISFLSERRAALNQQRDSGYSDIGALEGKESDLRAQFKDANGEITRRRVTSQLLQLRKDIERRHQLLGVLNQQINIVSTHLHNLQLQQQGQTAKLPDSEELATDAAAAEEVMAELQAATEAANSVGGAAPSGLSDEEQALYEELTREATADKTADASPAPVTQKASGLAAPTSTSNASPQRQSPPPLPQRGRSEAEAG